MANDRFYCEIEGMDKLFKELDEMGIKGEKAATKALKDAGKIFKNLAIAGVNYSSRNSDKHLRDAIDVSNPKMDDAGNKYVSVGTYLGNGNYRKGVYWGHIVEGGHRIVTPKGKVVGYVAARPFLQPAFDGGKDQAAKIIFDAVTKAMGLK